MNEQASQTTPDFLICIDSDGCVFDTVFLKHSECLIPSIIADWGLNSIGRAVRHVVEFVTQTSRNRGVNRWRGLLLTVDLLRDYPGVNAAILPDLSPLRAWMENEPRPSADALRLALQKQSDPVLKKALMWSDTLDETIDHLVNNLPAYPEAAATIPVLAAKAEVHVVTQAPGPSVQKQWQQAGLMPRIHTLHGQEDGAKADILARLSHKQPDARRKLMIGDAPGDLRAARENGWHFYPILPEEENASWLRLRTQIADAFFSLAYGGRLEEDAEAAFDRKFSILPPWQRSPNPLP